MQANEKKLRWVLKGNGAFSLLSGTGLIIAHQALADLMGVGNARVLLFIGIGLMLFSATVIQAGFRKSISPKQVQSIIIQDWAWVLGSGVIIGVEAWGLSALAYWIITGVALLVGDFAFFQMRYLRRLERT
ncbi:MAG: hypothetical protein HEP71_05960 [Roseivirga sp.]|nr:hypothetical protein [Roseivirga sp.]